MLVKLVDTDVIDEIFDGIIVILALKDSTDLDLDEDVVIGRARSHVQFKYYVLLRHQILNLSPW